jgi:galactokinase
MPSLKENISLLQDPKTEARKAVLYGSDRTFEKQMARYRNILDTYTTVFSDGDIHLFSTPGRTEIGGNHADLTEDYASIPSEMKSVSRALGKEVLRGIEDHTVISQISTLRKKTGDRALLRALHFIHENRRVTHQVEALEQNNFPRFLSLVQESGNSSFRWLQNCYSTKNPNEQSLSLALALTEKYLLDCGEGACRVHGGGFAGTIQAFLPAERLQSYITLMESVFGKGSVRVLTIRPVGSIHINTFLDVPTNLRE